MMLEACFYENHAPTHPGLGTMLQMLYYAPPKWSQPFRSQLPAMLHTVQCNTK
jgi:hypothetical protein